MTLSILKRVMCCTCALGITGAGSGTTDAGFPFFHHASYGPAPYTAFYGCGGCGACPSCYGYYGVGYRGYYGVGYRGFGFWSTNYVAYTPSYYATSYYAPSYYSASYYSPSCCGPVCNTVCDPCGVSCDPCGACGLASCYGCSFASVCCPTDCPTGIDAAPAGDSQPNDRYDGGESSPQTFQPPATNGQEPPGRFDDTRGGGDDDGGGSIFPLDNGGTQTERGALKPVEQRPGAEPADAEPSEPQQGEGPPQPDKETDAPPEDEGEAVDVPPAEIDSQLAAGVAVAPVRSRVRYTVRFLTPRLVRMEIAPHRSRTHFEAGPKLAATK